MKKLIIPIIVIAAVLYWYSNSSVPSPSAGSKVASQGQLPASGSGADSGSAVESRLIKDPFNTGSHDRRLFEEPIPASEKYSSSADAVAALKKGAVDYDDLTLQEFVELGDCEWCEEFYGSIKSLIKEEKDLDKKGYYAEVLAISARLDNIRNLVDGVEAAASEDDKDVLAEALELTIGGDDVVNYLAGYMSHEDELLQEAAVAAVSNQGSRLAAEYLYNIAVENKDPDGFYSVGIGLGEMVPDEEAFSFLQEAVIKRDEYSHLAVKSLINSGLPGLSIVVDVATSSKDPSVDKKFLDGALDHVAYDEETEQFLQKLASKTKVPFIKDWSEKVLDEFKLEEELDEEEGVS